MVYKPVPVTHTHTMHGNYPKPSRKDGLPSQRGGVPGNRGNKGGQVVRGSDENRTRLGEAWCAILRANAEAPAPYKLTDPEITQCIHALFPDRVGYKVYHRVNVFRNAYNLGSYVHQNGQPPDEDHWSWKYIRIETEPDPTTLPPEIPADEVLPWHVLACTPKGRPVYRVYPPEMPLKLSIVKRSWKVPAPDFSILPFPASAKGLYGRIRQEKLEKIRQSFMVFTQKWLAEQMRKRPWDFNPLLWQQHEWEPLAIDLPTLPGPDLVEEAE